MFDDFDPRQIIIDEVGTKLKTSPCPEHGEISSIHFTEEGIDIRSCCQKQQGFVQSLLDDLLE